MNSNTDSLIYVPLKDSRKIRLLPKKLPKIKKYGGSSYYERKLLENASNTLYDKQEKKRVYTKRTTEKIRRWTHEEADAYEKFIDMYSDIFNESGSKRVTKVFIQMSQYIGTKTPSQCRSHHQKFFKRLQRARMIANGQNINDEDFKKNKRNNNMRKKKKDSKNIIEAINNEIKPIIKEEKEFECEIAADPLCLNHNFIVNNNIFYDNSHTYYPPPNQIPNFYHFPIDNGQSKSGVYIRKTSFGEDMELSNLLDNKKRRKSSFSFYCGNGNQNEQDFSNFEKVYLGSSVPSSHYFLPSMSPK